MNHLINPEKKRAGVVVMQSHPLRMTMSSLATKNILICPNTYCPDQTDYLRPLPLCSPDFIHMTNDPKPSAFLAPLLFHIFIESANEWIKWPAGEWGRRYLQVSVWSHIRRYPMALCLKLPHSGKPSGGEKNFCKLQGFVAIWKSFLQEIFWGGGGGVTLFGGTNKVFPWKSTNLQK